MLRELLQSQSLRAATALGFGGVAFTLSNLVLARILPSPEYAVVCLLIGIVSVAGLAAPLGLDLVLGRQGLRLDAAFRRTVLGISTSMALLTTVLTAIFYHLEFSLLMCVFAATVASGVTQAIAGHFQGQRQFGAAVWMLQLSNWTLLLAALLTACFGRRTALVPCVLIALAGMLGAVVAWRWVARSPGVGAGGVQPRPASLLGEALSLVAIHTSNSVFLQLERLLLAPLVGVQALALFGVVAALVGSPFRMLQAAVLFTLTPNLRGARSVAERRRLLRREGIHVTAVIGAGSLVIWLVAPPLAHGLLSGRYDLSAPLMMAALTAGILKVCSAFATGIVIALAQDRSLRVLSMVSWTTIGVSVGAALAAAPWGLVAVLYAISTGWLLRAAIAAWMAIPHLRQELPQAGNSPAHAAK
ncbi:MAG TPA: hypothetical protein VH209_13315 [Steroidobacteraceae bacterium]|nr:hypothetical protein [Steroidobacteraceae bacterium]